MGNICRSPTAEGVFRAYVRRHAPELERVLVIDSAGTHDYHEGEPPDPRAQSAALRRGVDLSALRARQVAQQDFERFDLILAMDRLNHVTLLDRCPEHAQPKVRLLLEYSGHPDRQDIPDPYYGGPQGFDDVLDLLEEASATVLRQIQRSNA